MLARVKWLKIKFLDGRCQKNQLALQRVGRWVIERHVAVIVSREMIVRKNLLSINEKRPF
jgi:hypothetical protein